MGNYRLTSEEGLKILKCALKEGPTKYAAIKRLTGINADSRTIKSYIDKFMLLPKEEVIVKFPNDVWPLRPDHRELSQLNEQNVLGSTANVNLNSVQERDTQALKHDIRIFKESDEIIDEPTLDLAFSNLSDSAIFSYGLPVHLDEYLGFFYYESNQYIEPEINLKSKNMWLHLKELNNFLWNENFRPIYPDNKDDARDTHVLCPDKSLRFCSMEEAKKHPDYNELKQNLEKLVEKARVSYKEYRIAIREKLYQ